MIKLKLLDKQDKVIFNGKLTRLQIPEPFIIEKSTLWFNDPDPCFIHQGAVMKRLFIELEDELLEKSSKETNIVDITEQAKKILGKYESLDKITWK